MSVPAIDRRYSEIPEEVLGDGSGVPTQPIANPPDRRRLVVRLGDEGRWVIERALSMGQSPWNDVVIRDARVSRRHCRFEVADGRVQVRDLGSTNGTWVNGSRVSLAELRAGMVLTVGETRMQVGFEREGEKIVGESEVMRRLRADIARLAGADLGVLVTGETGTGKELVAHALHELSGRRGAFVAVNCGSIPRELVESELFGHERGAFTGAMARRAGVFEEADGGTLFLDEIGELPVDLQPRLLRVLETRVVRPVGSNRETRVDVRVVAATHVDLHAAVASGEFRRDLFYRLAHVEISAPPVRQRGEDLTLLVRTFLDELSAQVGPCRLSEEAWEALRKHPWPGNVRELRNTLKRAVALGGPLIGPEHLKLERGLRLDEDHEVLRLDGRTWVELEREILTRTVRKFAGNRRRAAHALGMAKSTLCDKVKRYGI